MAGRAARERQPSWSASWFWPVRGRRSTSNWEVLDLLKTASRQAASYLAQRRAAEALLEVQQFDAFNRMSAFVVHDLKNLVAQLSLLLRNAERHRQNPEFQRDVLETIDHVIAAA